MIVCLANVCRSSFDIEIIKHMPIVCNISCFGARRDFGSVIAGKIKDLSETLIMQVLRPLLLRNDE